MQITLNTVWQMAMPKWVALSPKMAGLNNARTARNSTRQTRVPMMLNSRCTSAARLAFLVAPTEDSMAVTQVPMFWPMMMGTAAA